MSFLQNLGREIEVGALNLLGNAIQANEARLEAAISAEGGNLVTGLIALVEKDDAALPIFVRAYINAALTEYKPQLEALLPTVAGSGVPQLVAAIFALKDKIAAGENPEAAA